MKLSSLILSLIILSMLWTSCKNSTTSESDTQNTSNSTGTTYNLPAVDLDVLTTRLYQNYHSKPSHQAHIDENKIIDFAIKHKMDVSKDETGLYYIIVKEGEGDYLKHADPVKCFYQGTSLDGTVFDGNFKTKKSLDFRVGEMIHGWNVGLKKVRYGGKAIFLVPSSLAYGEKGIPGRIAKNEILVFDLEVLNPS